MKIVHGKNLLMNDKINILQLCSYFTGSKVHQSLFSFLDKRVKQFILVPVKYKSKIGKNEFELLNGTLKYVKIWTWYHKVLYKNKILKVSNYITSLQGSTIQRIDIIHAHTWFSDGGSAYQLHIRHSIPYIVSVRNTDINMFYKKLYFLRHFGHQILLNASAIVFISPAYRDKLISLVPEKYKDTVRRKAIIIPNGIDNFWIQNQNIPKPIDANKQFKLLFVGKVIQLKNIPRLLLSYLKVKDQLLSSSITLIGFTKSIYERYINLRFGNQKSIRFINQISDKKLLLKVYREHDLLIMPSLKETFGLVYIEALSQGLPIIYSKGQGVDGYFDDINVGIRVDPLSTKEISDAILTIKNNYKKYTSFSSTVLDEFNLEVISKRHIDLYESVLVKNCNEAR